MSLNRRRFLVAGGLGIAAVLTEGIGPSFAASNGSTWAGTKKIAFIPVYRSFDPVPPNWADWIVQRVAYDPTGENGADVSLRAYFRTVSYGRADVEGHVLPAVYYPDADIPVSALEADYGESLRSQGYHGGVVVTLGGYGAGSAQSAGFWARVAMAEDVGVWAMEITHAMTGYNDLYVYPSHLDIFDNMASARGTHPSAFTKNVLGWLDQAAIIQHSNQVSYYELQALAVSEPQAGRFRAVRIGTTTPLMVEARLGVDQFDGRISSARQGVIVYRVESPDTDSIANQVSPKLILLTPDGLKVGAPLVTADGTEVRVVAMPSGGATIRVVSNAASLGGPIGDIACTVGQAISLQLSLTVNDRPLTWSATGLPPGVTLDPSTGLLSGKTVQPGVFTATYTAYDTYGYPLATGTVNITVQLAAPQGVKIAAGSTGLGWIPVWGVDNLDQVMRFAAEMSGGGWALMGGGLGGALRAVTMGLNSNGRVQVFGVTPTGSIRYRAQIAADRNGAMGAWGPWVSMDGLLYAVGVARNSDGRLELFGSNHLGEVYHRSQTGANATDSWTDWQAFDGPGMVKVAAATNNDGRIELFGMDGVGHIFHRAQLQAGGATGWSAWVQFDGTFTAFAVARGADKLDLYAASSSGSISRRTQTSSGSSTWTSWTSFAGPGTNIAQFTATTAWDGRIELVVLTPGNNVWALLQSSPGSWTNTSWTFIGSMTPRTIAVPNVNGLTQAAATQVLVNNAFDVTTSTVIVAEAFDNGTVVSQTPSAGTVITAGQTVHLGIGAGGGSTGGHL
jgi:hypothetical protein